MNYPFNQSYNISTKGVNEPNKFGLFTPIFYYWIV